MIKLKPFVNAEEIYIDPKQIESVTKHKSPYNSTVNEPYYIVTMRSGDHHEITVHSFENDLLHHLNKTW